MLRAVGVQPRERQPVAARELDELSRRLGRVRPDDLETDTGPRLKPLPAGVEGPQHQVAERAVFEHERAQLLTLDGDVAHRLGHDGREEDGLSREQVRLAEEAERAVADDLRTGLVEHGRLTFDDRDQRIAQVTDPEEHVADLRAPLLAVLGKQGKLSFGEPRRPGCHARTLSPGSAAADGRDHVDARPRLERGVERRSLSVDVHVDMPSQFRAGFAQAVAKAGPALLEPIERLVDRGCVDVEAARKAREERLQRRRQIELGHGQSMVVTSTDAMPGR